MLPILGKSISLPNYSIDSLMAVLSKSESDSQRVILYNQLSYSYYTIPDSSEKYYQLAYERAIRQHSAYLICQTHLYRMKTLRVQAKPKEEKAYFEKYRIFMEEFAVNDSILSEYYFYGASAYQSLSEGQNSYLFYRMAIDMAKEVNYSMIASGSYNNIANTYLNQGNYGEALRNYKEGLNYADTSDKEMISTLLTNIGIVYFLQKDMETARKNFEQSLIISPSPVDIYNLAYLGSIAVEEDVNWGIRYLRQALNKTIEVSYRPALSLVYRLMGDAMLKINANDSVIYYYNKSMAVARETQDKVGVISTSNRFARFYAEEKQLAKALDYSIKAFEGAVELKIYDIGQERAEYISTYYEKIGNISESFRFQKLYKTFTDSLVNYHNEAYVTQLRQEELFEKEKSDLMLSQIQENLIHEREIRKAKMQRNLSLMGFVIGLLIASSLFFNFILNRNSTNRIANENEKIIKQKLALEQSVKDLQDKHRVLEVQSKELEELNNTKNKFFSIIAHDLKNPFNVLIGFSQLMQLKFDRLSSEKITHIINQIEITIKSSYKLLENLLLWSNTQTEGFSVNPGEVDLAKLVNTNYSLFKAAIDKKEIQFKLHIRTDLQAYADENMISTVIRNLLSNAVKFCDRDDSITTTISQEGRYVQLSIKDTGIGINKENKSSIFSIGNKHVTPGTQNEKGTGLGLLLCKEFIEKNSGEIWFHSEEGLGSEFTFKIPAV